MPTKKKKAAPKAKAKAPQVTAEQILGMRRSEFRLFEEATDFDSQPKPVQRAIIRKNLLLDILDECKRAAIAPVRY